MNLARRLFFSRAAGAVAAAPMIARDAVAATERQRGALWQFTNAVQQGSASIPSALVSHDTWTAAQRIIRKSSSHGERERRKYRAELAGGLDPNIAALRSVALQHKIGMQIDRDTKRIQENSSFIANALRLAGVPEDEIWRHIEHY